jgi:hypothetical protein
MIVDVIDNANALEPLESRMIAAAHHEAGHIVVAAACGLRLRPKGIIIDPAAQGLACYDIEPNGSDALRKLILISTFAGFYAEQRCREQFGFWDCPENWLALGDGWQANEIVGAISPKNLVEGNVFATADEAKRRSRYVVAEKWSAITRIAEAVMAKGWGPLPEFKPEDQWSKEATAKQLTGDEIVELLYHMGIQAACMSGP